MTITSFQEKYIKEEVIADYVGEKTSIFFHTNKRLPNASEYKTFLQEANLKAQKLISRKS